MVHDLSIRYPLGSTIIYMDAFFPADPADIRKLYKVIQQGQILWSQEDPIDRILEHIKDRDQILKEQMYEAAADVVRKKTEYEELKTQYRDRKKSNGVPITRDELPHWKKYVKNADESWRWHQLRWKGFQRERKKLEQNKTLLLKLSGRYDGELDRK